jgi:hypothetical protein
MLATFLVGTVNTVLGDDTNFAGGGRAGFHWEDWGVAGLLQKDPTAAALGGGALYKAPLGNVDRAVGFRIVRQLASIAAQTAFLKTVDALVLQTGRLVLQPDSSNAAVLTYANAILQSAKIVAGPEATTGKIITMSYKFECSTLA